MSLLCAILIVSVSVGAFGGLGSGVVTAGEQVTITYIITTAETAGKTVSLSGNVMNLNTESLPDRSYTVTAPPAAPAPDDGGGDPIQVDVDPSDLPGNGTQSDPYEISNVSELQAMEDDLKANYVLVSDIDASQTAQFNDGKGFDPVGADPVVEVDILLRVTAEES